MKKLLIAAAVAGTMVSGVAFAAPKNVDINTGASVTLSTTGILNSPVCKVSDPDLIDLGTQDLGALNNDGVVGHKTFNIELTECAPAYYTKNNTYKAVDVKFASTANKIANTLTSDADGAQNVVVRLTKGATGQDITAAGDNVKTNLQVGNVSLQLGAEFYSEGNNATAGKFSGTTELTVYYK